MACSSGSLTNEEIKHRVQNIYTKFVDAVDPYPLCDLLVQEGVITSEKSQEIRCGHRIPKAICRDLLDFLLSAQHPKAFLVVREALCRQDSYMYLLKEIDIQESGRKQVDPLEASTATAHQTQDDGAATPAGNSETECLLGTDNQRQYGEPEAVREQPKIKLNFVRRNMRNIALLTTGVALLSCVIFIIVHISIESRRCTFGPTWIYTIRTIAAEANGTAIEGVTILEMELFVVSTKRSEVEVYNSISFSFIRKWSLTELTNPIDMTSCNKNKCLYVMENGPSSVILRVDGNGNLIKKWPVPDEWGRLSVTDEYNIIFIAYNNNKLSEYSPDGNLIREISLSSAPGISHPLHAIKLSNGHFAVSHGCEFCQNEELDRVCIVDANGKLLQTFGGKRGSGIGQLNMPFYLFVDKRGFVMVDDEKNGRVVLLNSDLAFKEELISKDKHGLRLPFRILLDESNDRLFVADIEGNNRRIAIFALNS